MLLAAILTLDPGRKGKENESYGEINRGVGQEN